MSARYMWMKNVVRTAETRSSSPVAVMSHLTMAVSGSIKLSISRYTGTLSSKVVTSMIAILRNLILSSGNERPVGKCRFPQTATSFRVEEAMLNTCSSALRSMNSAMMLRLVI